MPTPPTKSKLHSKTGKLKKIHSSNKSINNVASSSSTDTNSKNSGLDIAENSQSGCQFELELCWVIQQLESSISSGKLNEKQLQGTENIIKILKSPNQPLIKKRQLMRNTFGDYRAKMVEEEKKFSLSPKQIKFNSNKRETNKSYFIKKSIFTESGDKNFKFNFKVAQGLEDLKIENDSENEKVGEEVDKKLDQKSEFTFIPSGNSFKFNFNVEK